MSELTGSIALIASQSNQEFLCMRVNCVQKVFLQEHFDDKTTSRTWNARLDTLEMFLQEHSSPEEGKLLANF
jgi:hypothetical protein